MTTAPAEHLASNYLILFVVATAVAIAARHARVPFTVALVVAGLVLGALHLVPAPHLTRDLLYTIFLPGLLFEAAFHLDVRDVRRDVARTVVDKGWGLLELRPMRMSLEEIFLQLTTEEKAQTEDKAPIEEASHG